MRHSSQGTLFGLVSRGVITLAASGFYVSGTSGALWTLDFSGRLAGSSSLSIWELGKTAVSRTEATVVP